MGLVRTFADNFGFVINGINQVLSLLDLELIKTNRGIIQPWNEDAFFSTTWAEITKQTGSTADNTKIIKCYVLKDLLLASAPLYENVVECGVYKGATAIILASYIKEINILDPSKKMLLFDSFEGLSEPDPILDGNHFRKGNFAADLDSVEGRLRPFDFIEYWKGWIPARFEENSERLYSFVHVDLDLCEPVRHCIEFFYPRLIEGGMMVFDDYGFVSCPGVKKTVDEYLYSRNNVAIWLASGQGLVIKRKEQHKF